MALSPYVDKCYPNTTASCTISHATARVCLYDGTLFIGLAWECRVIIDELHAVARHLGDGFARNTRYPAAVA